MSAYDESTFVRGAKVYVNGRDLAIIRDAWPRGSVFFPWPHYRVDFIDGDRNVTVPWQSVGIEKASWK